VIKKVFVLAFVFLLYSCQEKKEQNKQKYLALGDSYTIGESVEINERWPVQLVKALEDVSILLNPPQIIAQTGWTTADLKTGIDSAVLDFPYDWVSLLIGVNNQYQGKSIDEFKLEFEQLLSQAILFAGTKKERVFVVSIPDWGKMPFAKDRDATQIALEIDNFNQAIYEICVLQEVAFIDITPVSRTLDSHPEFIASDGLHPSGAQYAEWVKEILPFFLNDSND
jgi:lysophospholipase L1-like esterase